MRVQAIRIRIKPQAPWCVWTQNYACGNNDISDSPYFALRLNFTRGSSFRRIIRFCFKGMPHLRRIRIFWIGSRNPHVHGDKRGGFNIKSGLQRRVLSSNIFKYLIKSIILVEDMIILSQIIQLNQQLIH